MEHQVEYLTRIIHCIFIFYSYDFPHFSHLLSRSSFDATQMEMLLFKFDLNFV
jgi:hypothetical protein